MRDGRGNQLISRVEKGLEKVKKGVIVVGGHGVMVMLIDDY
jgi:hypothetical protein